MHKTTQGEFANQAVLSFIYAKVPGETRRAFNNFNLNNLPDPKNNDPAKDDPADGPILGPINVLDFLYDDKQFIIDNKPFNWYRYWGSETQPPCAENVMWIIVNEPL